MSARLLEWIRILHSVRIADNRKLIPCDPSKRQTETTQRPWGKAGRPVGGGNDRKMRSPDKKGIEQFTAPAMGFWKSKINSHKLRCKTLGSGTAFTWSSLPYVEANSSQRRRRMISITPMIGKLEVRQMPTGTHSLGDTRISDRVCSWARTGR